MKIIDAYPLEWPAGYVRTDKPKRSVFKCTFGAVCSGVLRELKLLGAVYPVISTNVPLRNDGLPRATSGQPVDRGVAVYFMMPKTKQPCVLACDRWDRVEDNLRAVELAVKAMRGLDRWGVSEILDRAFSGFTALPPPSAVDAEPHWSEILGVDRNASLKECENAYRSKLKVVHPDAGGSHDAMVRLNRAISEVREQRYQ